MQVHSECGLELLSRFHEKPNSINLDNILFSNGVINSSIMEIIGATSTGKTILLCQFIAKCILPTQCNEIKIDGCDSCVILIDTLNHIQISKIAELMSTMIYNAYKTAGVLPLPGSVDSIITNSLENLTVYNCCNNDQFLLVLHTLQEDLFNNNKIVLLAIDNILAYYWQERKRKGLLSMDCYVKSLIKVIRMRMSQFKIITVYTRLYWPVSEHEMCIKHIALLGEKNVNYRLQLYKHTVTREYICCVESVNNIKRVHYTICNCGIKWVPSLIDKTKHE